MIDGGFVRGTDVVKAVALGAKAVAIGKLQGWALGSAGHPGLVRALELLEAGIRITMGLVGVTKVDQLGPGHVCKALVTALPHEMSAFVNLPSRLL